MNIALPLLREERCPECRAEWVQAGRDTRYDDGQVLRHVNGGEWQWVKYACGRVDKFIPNFDCIKTERPCSNNPEQQADKRRKETAKKQALSLLKDLGLTAMEREAIERQIRCTLEH